MKVSRRNFMVNTARTLIASGLAVTGGILLFREESEEGCTDDFACGNCGKKDDCKHPEADLYRKTHRPKSQQ